MVLEFFVPVNFQADKVRKKQQRQAYQGEAVEYRHDEPFAGQGHVKALEQGYGAGDEKDGNPDTNNHEKPPFFRTKLVQEGKQDAAEQKRQSNACGCGRHELGKQQVVKKEPRGDADGQAQRQPQEHEQHKGQVFAEHHVPPGDGHGQRVFVPARQLVAAHGGGDEDGAHDNADGQIGGCAAFGQEHSAEYNDKQQDEFIVGFHIE